jgi:hypothetical protein
VCVYIFACVCVLSMCICVHVVYVCCACGVCHRASVFVLFCSVVWAAIVWRGGAGGGCYVAVGAGQTQDDTGAEAEVLGLDPFDKTKPAQVKSLQQQWSRLHRRQHQLSKKIDEIQEKHDEVCVCVCVFIVCMACMLVSVCGIASVLVYLWVCVHGYMRTCVYVCVCVAGGMVYVCRPTWS